MTTFGVRANSKVEPNTHLTELKPGFRWARLNATYSRGNPSHWVVIYITGSFPFFRASVVFDPEGCKGLSNLHFPNPDNDPSKWEYGPELQIPDKHWVRVEAMKPDDK